MHVGHCYDPWTPARGWCGQQKAGLPASEQGQRAGGRHLRLRDRERPPRGERERDRSRGDRDRERGESSTTRT